MRADALIAQMVADHSQLFLNGWFYDRKMPSGVGFLTITDRYMEQFNTLLVEYYTTGDSEALKDFLYENTIQGIV